MPTDRQLRQNRVRLDYKKMSNQGEITALVGEEESQDPQGAIGFSQFGASDEFGREYDREKAEETLPTTSDIRRQQLERRAPVAFQDEEDDQEMAEMQDELRRLNESKQLIKRDQKKAQLQQQIAQAKKDIDNLVHTKGIEVRSKSQIGLGLSHKLGVSQPSHTVKDSNTTIHDLRKHSSLNQSVSSRMRKMGLAEISDSDSSTSSDHDSDVNSDEKSSSGKKSKKKVKSGITAKASDRVKKPKVWPHSSLQITHVSKAVKFEELDFPMFVAGELETISTHCKSEAEVYGRVTMLKLISYYKATYEWKALLDLYAAWLRQIELGQRSWSDDITQLEHVLLAGNRRSDKDSKESKDKSVKSSQFSRPSKSGDDSIWFCSLFQRNKCVQKTPHMLVVKGRMRHVLHICATCWQKDKQKLPHSESSSACPHMA